VRNIFKNCADTALPKNGFSFAIENIIARFKQREHVAKQVRLPFRSVLPNRLHCNDDENFADRNKRRERYFPNHSVPSKVDQSIGGVEQRAAAQHGTQRIKWRVVIMTSHRPESLKGEKIGSTNHQDKYTPKGQTGTCCAANDLPRDINDDAQRNGDR